MTSDDQDARTVKLFRCGRHQVIRIPREVELPGDTALLHREGNRLVIEPMERPSLKALLASWEPLTDGLPPFEDSRE